MNTTYIEQMGMLKKIGEKTGCTPFDITWDNICVEFTDNIRCDYGENLDRFDSLEFIQIYPIVGYMNADGKFVPGDGFSRLRWIKKRLESGFTVRPITVVIDPKYEVLENRLDLMINSANSKPLTQLEQGKGFKRYRDELGFSNSEIAARCFKTVAHVGQCLNLVDNSSEAVLEAITEGLISASEVIKINSSSSVTNDEAESLILEATEKAKVTGKKATGKSIKALKADRETKVKTEDKPSEFGEGDEFKEHLEICKHLSMLSEEDWKEIDLGPLRKILAIVNKA